MDFGSFNSHSKAAPMAEINVIPLVDIMLVLLVIFIITAPLLTHAVKIDLPRAESSANLPKVDNVQLAIDGAGLVYWNGEVVDTAALDEQLKDASAQPAQPEIHVHADRDARYQVIAEVMSAAAKHGLSKIGFVTDPNPQR